MPDKILIIEDDPLIADDLREQLNSLGYNVIGTTDDKSEALMLVNNKMPQLIISDIILEDRGYDGIDIIKAIYENYKAPVIYLTANSELATVKKATNSQPSIYLMKPFRLSELAINIELAIKNFKDEYDFEKANELLDDSVFIPENFIYHRLPKQDILYAEADGAYTTVFTKSGKKYQMSLNLKHFQKQLDDSEFLRVSRKHLVNTCQIEKINGNTLYLAYNTDIPISTSKRKAILNRFPILKSR